jgi:hypothetical protein
MKNKISLYAGIIAVALSSTVSANVLLNSSSVDVLLSTGTGIQKDYAITVTPTFTTDPSNPTAVNVINNIPSNQFVAAGTTVPLKPALVFYTNKMNPLKGGLGFTFTATFDNNDVFTNTYQVPVDNNGNIIDSDDLPAAQNGVVCEFITSAGIPNVTNPQISIQCQDYNS